MHTCFCYCFDCREIVKLLLTHEANINVVDSKGLSSLHLAAWSGDEEIVRLLLTHGPSVPNVNLKVSVKCYNISVQR